MCRVILRRAIARRAKAATEAWLAEKPKTRVATPNERAAN